MLFYFIIREIGDRGMKMHKNVNVCFLTILAAKMFLVCCE